MANLKDPRDVAMGPAGELYVSDRTNDRVVLWAEGAQEGHLFASVNKPTGLATEQDQDGFLFVTEQNGNQVT